MSAAENLPMPLLPECDDGSVLDEKERGILEFLDAVSDDSGAWDMETLSAWVLVNAAEA